MFVSKEGKDRFYLFSIALLVLLLASCFEIVRVNQPTSASVGEEITVTIDVEVTGKDGGTLIFGFCAPRAWQAAKNTTVSFTSSIGNSTLSLIDPSEVDAEMKKPWAEQITEREGFGGNYGEMSWTVFKADNDFTPPDDTNEDNPVTGTITLKTVVGQSNIITQLGYFLGEGFWGYLGDGSNSLSFFEETCLEVSGAPGQAVNLCGPQPRKLINLETYTFNDLITITFDATEDETDLIGASGVYLCARAVTNSGTSEVCERSPRTALRKVGEDLWSITIWPPTYFDIEDGNSIGELLMNFQNESGDIIVRAFGDSDFQVLPKCF